MTDPVRAPGPPPALSQSAPLRRRPARGEHPAEDGAEDRSGYAGQQRQQPRTPGRRSGRVRRGIGPAERPAGQGRRLHLAGGQQSVGGGPGSLDPVVVVEHGLLGLEQVPDIADRGRPGHGGPVDRHPNPAASINGTKAALRSSSTLTHSGSLVASSANRAAQMPISIPSRPTSVLPTIRSPHSDRAMPSMPPPPSPPGRPALTPAGSAYPARCARPPRPAAGRPPQPSCTERSRPGRRRPHPAPTAGMPRWHRRSRPAR